MKYNYKRERIRVPDRINILCERSRIKNMIRIAVCDDDNVLLEHAYDEIKSAADKLGKEYMIQTFQDGNIMLTQVAKEISVFDILFLDIDMPSISGFEVAEILRRVNGNLVLIFLTSMEHLVYESFKYKPFRFIRKQKMEEEIEAVLCSAVAEAERIAGAPYRFKTEDGDIKLSSSDIMYIECLNRKVQLKMKDKQYSLVGLRFNEIVNELRNKGFVLIHRTCLVNLKYVFSIGRIDITLDNGEKLPMSRYKMKEVKKAFTLYAE